MQPDFWLTESGNEAVKATGLSSDAAIIQPGDLVALDEIWRFWSGFGTKDADGKKRPDSVMNFFRMHRHFTHPETGVSCDLALITQDVMDLSRQVRAVIEETYRMEKLTAIGSTKRYRVDVCQGGQTRKALRQIQREYDPKYFPLYSSHSGRKEGEAQAVEENIDQRGNLLKGALFKVIIPAALLVGIIAVWSVAQYFTPDESPKDEQPANPPAATNSPMVTSGLPPQNAVDETESWRVVGWITGQPLKVIIERDGKTRTIEPPNYKLTGLTLEAFLPNGEAVAPWTGGASRRGLMDQAQP
jgi:zona occludens toxin